MPGRFESILDFAEMQHVVGATLDNEHNYSYLIFVSGLEINIQGVDKVTSPICYHHRYQKFNIDKPIYTSTLTSIHFSIKINNCSSVMIQ